MHSHPALSSIASMTAVSLFCFSYFHYPAKGFPDGSVGKESTCNAGDPGLIPGLGRSPGEGKGYPLQYSSLQNSMDCIDHGVTKSQTQLNNFHSHSTKSKKWKKFHSTASSVSSYALFCFLCCKGFRKNFHQGLLE